MPDASSDASHLRGSAALVTGAGRGIGKAIALALARAGCDVALAARSVSQIEEVADAARASGVTAIVRRADVTDPSQCRAFVTETIESLGRLDILVNNAGGATFRHIWEYTDSDFDAHYALDLRSVFACSSAALPHMMERGSGVIVNVASSSGKKPYARQGPYCAMKAAVISLSKVMALELRQHGIRVHAVCPGAVDTAMADLVHPERDREGWLQPDDVAAVVLDLLRMSPNATIDEVAVRRLLADPL